MDQDIICVNIRVEGRVQGVWYRSWLIQEANHRALAGWVRNRSDGTVEAVISGPRNPVDEVLALCRKGPPAARVDHLTIKVGEAPEGEEFKQVQSK